MVTNQRYRINNPPFVHQDIEGEIVIVNLENGFYYSLRHSAAAIWALLECGASTQKILQTLEGRYQASPGQIEAGLEHLLADLRQEGVLSECSATDSIGLGQTAVAVGIAPGMKPRFSSPVLEKFTDMKDLLLLDPIHEVDNTGWPIVKNQAA